MSKELSAKETEFSCAITPMVWRIWEELHLVKASPIEQNVVLVDQEDCKTTLQLSSAHPIQTNT